MCKELDSFVRTFQVKTWWVCFWTKKILTYTDARYDVITPLAAQIVRQMAPRNDRKFQMTKTPCLLATEIICWKSFAKVVVSEERSP